MTWGALWSVQLEPYPESKETVEREPVFYGDEASARKEFKFQAGELLKARNTNHVWVYLVNPDGDDVCLMPCEVTKARIVNPGNAGRG